MKQSRAILRGLAILAVIFLASGCGSEDRNNATTTPDTADRSEQRQITIGYVNWAEAVAVSQLVKTLLETQSNYDVTLQPAKVEQVFKGVANGRMDVFLDVWLPKTHKAYWQQYGDQLVDLGPWYADNATLGIAVPDYVAAQSIADLKGQADQYGSKIVGIEPGAGIMRISSEQLMPAYGLDGYELTTSSTPDMIEKLDQAIANRQPIAITAWKPHWIFSAYPIRYLDDPKNSMGDAEKIHVVARKGFKSDHPGVYNLLDSFRLSEDQLESLELSIEDSRSAYGGVNDWLSRHPDIVEQWREAANAGKKRSLF